MADRTLPESEREAARLRGALVDLERHKQQLEETLEQLRQNKQQLQDALTNVRQTNRDLEQFAQVAGHDLKAPLRNIDGFSEMLVEHYSDVLDDRGKRFLGHIRESVEQMQALLDDLLLYARAGTGELDFEPVDLDAVLRAVRHALQTTIEASGAEIDDVPLPTVLADRTQMGQLLQNLLGNALKYRSDVAPRIALRAERISVRFWRLSVTDNGIGVDPSQSEAIFETFRRLHGVGEYPGTGVGLAICRRIAQRHGGRIWVDSEPGRGSTFYLTLPALPGA